MADRLIMIDAGHGGEDLGAQHNGAIESHINLELAMQLHFAMNHCGWPIRAELIRTGDDTLSLTERSMIAGDAADLVLSIHCNAMDALWPTSGLMAFHWPGNSAGLEISASIARAAPAWARHKRPVWAVAEGEQWLARARNVVGCYRPTCVLVECGFLTNAHDAEKLQTNAGQRSIVAAVLCGVARYLEVAPDDREREESPRLLVADAAEELVSDASE